MLGNLRTACTMSPWILLLGILTVAESVIAGENDPYGSGVTPTFGPTKFHWLPPPGSSGSQQSTTNPWTDDEVESLVAALKQKQGASPPQGARPSSTSDWGNTGTSDLSGAESDIATENDPYESRVPPTSGPTKFHWGTPPGSSGSQQTTTTPWKDDEVDSGFAGTGGQATEGIPQQQAPAGWGRFPLSRGNPPPRPQYQSSGQESPFGVTSLFGSGGYKPAGSSSTYKDEEVTKEDTPGYLSGSSPPLYNHGSEDAYKPTGSFSTSPTYLGKEDNKEDPLGFIFGSSRSPPLTNQGSEYRDEPAGSSFTSPTYTDKEDPKEDTQLGYQFGSSPQLANHGSEGGYKHAGSSPTYPTNIFDTPLGSLIGSPSQLANHGSEKQYTFKLPSQVDDADEDDTQVSVPGPSQGLNAERTFTNFPKIPAPGAPPPEPTTGQQPWSSYEEQRYSNEDQFSYTQ